MTDFTEPPRPRLPRLRRERRRRQRRVLRTAREPDPARARRHRSHTFGHKGKEYDGWETRRRREPGRRLGGRPARRAGRGAGRGGRHGVLHRQLPAVRVGRGGRRRGLPGGAELADLDWTTLVPRSAARGRHRATPTRSPTTGCWTHVRLTIHPDGGVARLPRARRARCRTRASRAASTSRPLRAGARWWPAPTSSTGRPAKLILPGRARHMGEGWENARRRDGGNDWALFRLGRPGRGRATSSWTRRTSSATHPASSGSPAARAPPTTPTELDAAAWWDLVPRRPARAGHPAPLPRRRPSVRSRTSGWTSTRTAGWPGCGSGASRGTDVLSRLRAMPEPLTHRVQPMSGRDPDQDHRAATPLELLFDLRSWSLSAPPPTSWPTTSPRTTSGSAWSASSSRRSRSRGRGSTSRGSPRPTTPTTGSTG